MAILGSALPTSAVLALLLVAFLAPALVTAMAGEWADESFDQITSETQRKSMPNPDDPAMRERLTCSACYWCVVEFHSDIVQMEKAHNKSIADWQAEQKIASENKKLNRRPLKFPGKSPSQEKVDEIVDELCDRHLPNYGLHVDPETDQVKPKYTKLAGRLQGAWVARLFHNTCSEFVAPFQDDDRKRKWKYLKSFWGANRDISEERFYSLCPVCNSDNGRLGFPARSESLMWMDEATRMQEDWDL